MDEQTSERINAVETEVAVIKSTYVKRDEFAALRADIAENFGHVERRFGDVERQFGEVRAEIANLGTSMLKWMVATHLAFYVAIITTVHYVR